MYPTRFRTGVVPEKIQRPGQKPRLLNRKAVKIPARRGREEIGMYVEVIPDAPKPLRRGRRSSSEN